MARGRPAQRQMGAEAVTQYVYTVATEARAFGSPTNRAVHDHLRCGLAAGLTDDERRP